MSDFTLGLEFLVNDDLPGNLARGYPGTLGAITNILIGLPLSKVEGTSWYVFVMSILLCVKSSEQSGSALSKATWFATNVPKVQPTIFTTSPHLFDRVTFITFLSWPTHDLESVHMYRQTSMRSGSQSQGLSWNRWPWPTTEVRIRKSCPPSKF